ncbi:hypothetical protein [Ligilactobacillus hayakitensis]|nr:hypothetical protein [Ligilactobacillus hayakitensis]
MIRKKYSIIVAMASLMLLGVNPVQAASINPPATTLNENQPKPNQEDQANKSANEDKPELIEVSEKTAAAEESSSLTLDTKEKDAQSSIEDDLSEDNQAAITDAAKEGIHVNGNQIIDENNQRASNWVAVGSKIIDNNGQVVQGLSVDRQSGAVLATDTNTQVNRQTVYDVIEVKAAKQKPVFLPATGDKKQRLSLFGGIFVGIGSLLGFAIIDHRSKVKLQKDIFIK